jgi:Glycosyl hydrolase catalytic core
VVGSERKQARASDLDKPLRYYTWSSWPTDKGSSLEWVPQLWGHQSTNDWESNINGQFKPLFEQGKVKAVIGFNE